MLDVDDFLDTLRRVAANGRDSREEHHDQLGLPERFEDHRRVLAMLAHLHPV